MREDAATTVPCELSEDALRALRDHEWKGNVRELRSVLRRAAMLCPNGLITAAELDLRRSTAAKKEPREPLTVASAVGLLRDHAGNVSAAARAAGLPRSTFRNLLASQRRESVLEQGAQLERTG